MRGALSVYKLKTAVAPRRFRPVIGRNSMAPKTPPPENERFRAERLSVLVALAAQPPAQPSDAHPSPEELAAFGEERLNPVDRERILAHLDTCSDCYEEWLAVADTLATTEPAGGQHRRCELPVFGTQWHHRRRRTWVLSGAGVALAACLVLALLVPWRTDSGLPALIERAYQTARAGAGPDLREIAARDTAPRREPTSTYGFSAGAGSDTARAFAAGLLEGRAMLAPAQPKPAQPTYDFYAERPRRRIRSEEDITHEQRNIPPPLSSTQSINPPTPPTPTQPIESIVWQDTEWADYALLGRWVYLLQTICKTSAQGSPAIWEAQHFIAAGLRDRLARRPAGDTKARPVAAVVQDVEKKLGDTELVANPRRLCSQLDQSFDRLGILLHLAPSP